MNDNEHFIVHFYRTFSDSITIVLNDYTKDQLKQKTRHYRTFLIN